MTPRALLLTLIALVGASIVGAAVHEPQTQVAAEADAPWFTVMTYNVHQYWSTAQTGGHSIDEVKAVLAGSGADVIGLQETEGARVTSGSFAGVRWLADQLGFHAAPGPPAREGTYGVSLLSRWPILATEWHFLPNREGVERVVLVADVDHPNATVTMAVTHLGLRELPDERARQARALVRHLAHHDRMVLVGDFNTPPVPSEEAYAVLAEHFADAWLVAGRSPTAGITELDRAEPARVDQVWVRGDWLVDTCSLTGGPEASDHRAMMCRLRPT